MFTVGRCVEGASAGATLPYGQRQRHNHRVRFFATWTDRSLLVVPARCRSATWSGDSSLAQDVIRLRATATSYCTRAVVLRATVQGCAACGQASARRTQQHGGRVLPCSRPACASFACSPASQQSPRRFGWKVLRTGPHRILLDRRHARRRRGSAGTASPRAAASNAHTCTATSPYAAAS